MYKARDRHDNNKKEKDVRIKVKKDALMSNTVYDGI